MRCARGPAPARPDVALQVARELWIARGLAARSFRMASQLSLIVRWPHLFRSVRAYTHKQWREDAEIGLIVAVGIGVISTIPIGLLGLGNLWRLLRGQALELPWLDYGAVIAVVWGSYLVAGQLGAAAYFLLRPAQRWVLGWMAIGAALAVAIYGTIGYTLAIFYDPVGRLILQHSSRAEAWDLARSGTCFFAVGGALFGAYHVWRVRTGRAARDAAA